MIVLVAAGLAAGAATLAEVLAGGAAAAVAVIVVEVAILSFVTVRAYPPGTNRHFLRFFVLTLLFSAFVPLIYLSWLWMTGKKWPAAALEPAAQG